MRISKLSASKHKKGRILVQLDSGELLRIGEREAVAFRSGPPWKTPPGRAA